MREVIWNKQCVGRKYDKCYKYKYDQVPEEKFEFICGDKFEEVDSWKHIQYKMYLEKI